MLLQKKVDGILFPKPLPSLAWLSEQWQHLILRTGSAARRPYWGGILLSVAASAMTALSTSVTMYYVSRFVVALGVAGYADVIYTLIMETVSPRFRYMPTMTMGNGWTTGMLLLPWLHYLTKEWRATQLYATLPLAPLFLLGCFLPESPRWLMAVGRFPAAKQVVAKFARNAPKHVVDDIIEEAKRKKAEARDIGRASVADLFSTKVWTKITTLFSFQLIISSIVWYHMTVSTAAAGGNPYVSFTIGASSEYPLWSPSGFCQLNTRGCGWALLMLGKVGTSVNGAVLRVQLSETYPTVVRSVAMGFCYTLGRLGSALAPFFDDLGEATQSWVPSIVSAGLCLAGAGASWLLPESFEKTLEDGFSKHEATENKVAVTGNTEPQQIYVLEMTHF
ncbi:hypothetical protein MRX96_043422 [Rhipicephalus microplus]